MTEPTAANLMYGLLGTCCGLAFGVWLRRGLLRRIEDLESVGRKLLQQLVDSEDARDELTERLVESEQKRRNLRKAVVEIGKENKC